MPGIKLKMPKQLEVGMLIEDALGNKFVVLKIEKDYYLYADKFHVFNFTEGRVQWDMTGYKESFPLGRYREI
jgi:hypothetical protein